MKFRALLRAWQVLQEPILQAVLVFVICFSLFLWFGMSINFPDPDSFYHAKIAEFIADGQIFKDFPWQQFTVLKDYGIDQHFLWHAYLAPFSLLVFPFGIKLAVVILAAGFCTLFYWLLRKLKVPLAFWFALLISLTTPWTFRINLVKANTTSLIFLFLGLYFIFKKKKKPLDYILFFVLCFFYVWAYGGFALIFFFVLLFWLVNAIVEAAREEVRIKSFFDWLWKNIKLFFKKFFMKNKIVFAVVSVVGLGLGMIINPYFPKNLSYWWQQLVQIGIVNYQDKIGVGGEWYPYAPLDLTAGSIVLFLIAVFALVMFFIKIKKQSAISWTTFLLAIFFTFWNIKSRRYVEYSIPFIGLFSAVSLRDSLAVYNLKDFINKLKKFFFGSLFNGMVVFLVVLLITVSCVVIFVKEQKATKNDLRGGMAADKFKQSMSWLKDNSEEGEIVLHSDWDEWPLLFYQNSKNYYIVGLDPTFMYNYDQDLYWQWVNITIGKQRTDLHDIIKNNFNASWVFLETDHPGMDSNISNSEGFELKYEDNEAKIYQVL